MDFRRYALVVLEVVVLRGLASWFFSFSLFLLSGLVLRRFGLVDLQRVQGSLPVRLARFGVVRGVTRGISSLALVSLTVDVW